MGIRDWSSDVCSSDLHLHEQARPHLIFQAVEPEKSCPALFGCPRNRTLPSISLARLLSMPTNTAIWLRIFSRSDERRVGKECVSTCRSRCSQYHSKQQR